MTREVRDLGTTFPRGKAGEKGKELLLEFLRSEKAKGRREQYLIGLRHRVPRLLRFLEEQDLGFSEVRVRHALAFQGLLLETRTKKGNRYSPRTVLSLVAAAVSFYDFLKERGLVCFNPFKEMRKVRADKKLPRNILKEKEMCLFLERLSLFNEVKTLKERVTAYRVHIIAELQYASGLRISEVAALKPSDIDLARSLVLVCDGKGGASRTAFLTEFARETLRIYLDRMRPLVFSEWNERNGSLLFGTGWAWLEHLVNRTLKKTALETGMKGLTSHGFRHALGYHLLRSGCNVRHIQEILGHKRLRNTEVYTHVDREDLKAVMDRHHPRRLKRGVFEDLES